jgi:ribosome-binding protein aMBF1 (putative translation factor)
MAVDARGKVSPVGDGIAQHRAHRRKADPKYRAFEEQARVAEQIARLLIKYRMDHNLTQRQLGDHLDMKESAISRLESGQHTPSVSTICRITATLEKRLVFADALEV